MQLASIVVPLSSGHRECTMGITVSMPGVEAHHVVRSQDGIHVIIDYFTVILPWPVPKMVYA